MLDDTEIRRLFFQRGGDTTEDLELYGHPHYLENLRRLQKDKDAFSVACVPEETYSENVSLFCMLTFLQGFDPMGNGDDPAFYRITIGLNELFAHKIRRCNQDIRRLENPFDYMFSFSKIILQ